VQLVLSIALAAAGGWISYKACVAADDRTRIATSGLIALAVISPLLVLPLLGTGAVAAHHGRLNAASDAIVAIVLLNLCALLPIVVLTHYGRQIAFDLRPRYAAIDNAYATTQSISQVLSEFRPMPFPLAVWRVDTVLLMVLGLLLIPVSLGRIILSRGEGLAMALVYAAYLVVSTALAMRL
jgi:hypothetical protein